ncbi:unnamed protein product [Peronospora destructor]|uniref:Chorein N-terminal domain-containing protein n=1 Tax=Peronospora destructor TaxID=86335 RepID=A0AAV0VAW6_9STRA|nr:unnamed protein product [Peronospora destructor]
MLDLLSPLRGYIAQNLQFYLSKYIEDIQLERLGLFGGDLVLNDLAIKRHVLRESLDIPSSFDFSRGFIRELRIHIPWTQLVSQPIEVKLYTIELILTAKSDTIQRVARSTSVDTTAAKEEQEQEKIEQPKSGWIHDTLQKILANISVQVNNLVLKYEHDDVVFSIALGTLDFYSASENDGWKRSFEELKGGQRTICKRIDANDVTIFLDRYTSEGNTKFGMKKDPVRRNVVGYEVPVLSRTSASVRAKLQLFSDATMKAQDNYRSNLSSSRSPVHQRPSMANDVEGTAHVLTPTYEVDVFIGELFFSVSDRQFEMLNQLMKCASLKTDQAHEQSPEGGDYDHATSVGNNATLSRVPDIPSILSSRSQSGGQKVSSSFNKHESWFGWAMNALGTAEGEEEDELVSELLAETRGALLKVKLRDSNVDEDPVVASDSIAKTSCLRLCISSVSLTLRKHENVSQRLEYENYTISESKEELVPVANLGMVKVTTQSKRREVARPAVPIFKILLSYVALEMLLPRGEEQSGMDLVFEIKKVELASATISENRDDLKCKNGEVLLTWGSIDSARFSDCLSHPYFINSFFGEETTRLNQREARSFEIVKVGLDTGNHVWKTLEVSRNLAENLESPCVCSTTWNGESIRCIPIVTVSGICQEVIRFIGIKERILDGGILSNAVSTAWASTVFPILISKEMTRALFLAAEEYRAHRNPDVGALDNLTQLLLPQLIALFSRYTLHSCSASSLYSSSRSSTNIRHRSIHSALRLRLASTSNFTDRNESLSDAHSEEERARKVLDISISDVYVVLEPSKCVAITKALSVFLRRNEKVEGETGMGGAESVTSATTFAAPGIPTIVKSDITLVTIGSVHIRVPDQPAEPRENGLESSVCGDLNVVARDFAWFGDYHPGSSKKHLQLGALSAYMKRLQNTTTPIVLIEALGLDFLVTTNSADHGGDNDDFFTSLNKLRVNVTLSAARDVASVINELSSPLGYPIIWTPLHLASKTLQTTFQIETCGAAFSRMVSNQPRLLMAERQSLSAEIASVSVSLTRAESKNKAACFILQGGVAPMMIRGSELNTSLFEIEISQEKSSGVLHAPLLDSLCLFSLNPGSLATTCTHCHIAINAQLARLFVDVEGVVQLLGAVLGLAQEVMANLPFRNKSSPRYDNLEQDAKEENVKNAPTGWTLAIDLKAAGGDVRVNEALQLNVPLLSVSSVEMDTGLPTQVRSGGVSKIACTMKGATLGISAGGVLKGLENARILSIQDVRIIVDFSHTFADCRHAYTVDITLYVATIQASLSRLKLLYLLKLPFVEVEAQPRKLPFTQVSQLQEGDDSKVGSGAATCSQWYWKLGAQLDHIGISSTADIGYQSTDRNQQIRVIIEGKVSKIAVAARIGNYHPTKNHIQPAAGCGNFTDIQVYVGDVQVVERLQSARRDVRTAFGVFSRLPEQAFLGILVCLDLTALRRLSETFRVSGASTNTSNQQLVHSTMLSWQLTSNIAKVFQKASVERELSEANQKYSAAEIPLVISWSDPALPKSTQPFPLLSGFYRNYSEAGLPRHVVAGSVESVDVAVTTSTTTNAGTTRDFKSKARRLGGAIPQDSLVDIEVSLLCGQIRLILPSESIMDAIILARPVSGNIFVVLESLSVASAVGSGISLDGLGYPPFNSRVLPRRPTVQAQRFGQPQMRIGCRAGKIFGLVAKLQFDEDMSTANSMLEGKGPFEDHIGRVSGHSAHFSKVETFWSPFNVTCSLEEKRIAANEADETRMKIFAIVALTKLRLDLRKATFDVLVTRVLGLNRGISVLSRSIVPSSRLRLKTDKLLKSRKPVSVLERTCQREVSFSCDGIEMNTFDSNTSTHVRVGAITIRHNITTLAGSASVQNLVVGHQTNEGAQNSECNRIAAEDVVFGANAEPSLWQLAVENYPEKLIAARWDFGDHSDGTLFLDVQSYQLHVSHHFVLGLSRFAHLKPNLLFSKSVRGVKVDEQIMLHKEHKPFVFHHRWNIKVLVAPGVMSYWRENSMKRRRSGVWMTSGQLFVSMRIGSDDKAQQSLHTYGQTVNEITRFVDVPTLEMMMNIDKLGINTSDDLPLLQVYYQSAPVGPIPPQTSSTWLQFSKYISAVSEAQHLLHDCSVQITGVQHQILERVLVADTEICLLYTDMARLSIQAEVNTFCVKVSSLSLGVIQSLLTVRAVSDDYCGISSYRSFGGSGENFASETFMQRSYASEKVEGYSTDDFSMLRRRAEGRRPLPGELMFTKPLLIETQSVFSAGSSPIADMNVQIQIDPNKYDIKLADVAAYLKDCNEPWTVEGPEPGGEQSFYAGMSNKTHSWMGMRWCYHIPRKICKIKANPVPIPPAGIPNGWPSWSWGQDQDDHVGRLCDIFCQLRYWDSKRKCYAVVCEFYVPWELTSTDVGSGGSENASEPESFGELVSQWFDDGIEESRYRSKLLEFGARRRVFVFNSNVSSDNWELRWRTPLQSEQESENKQRRLVVNALLASSLQVNSILTCDAYQRVVSSITLPQIMLSVSHVDSRNDSHDIITAELNDTVISCMTSGSCHTRTLTVRLSSSVQAYVDNMAQLLTVSVIPRTSVDVMAHISPEGLELSTLIGPISVYLNQTTVLVMSAIPKLLQVDQKPSYWIPAQPHEKLSNMRIRIVNSVGMDIWYRQEGTSERLLLAADTSTAYSWLSLASSPFYQLRFAVNDPGQKLTELQVSENKQTENKHEDPRWCDPCRIKENAVTGRYFVGHGFLWICVELSGLQTVVTLRSSLTVQNYCDFPVLIRANEDASVFGCKKSDKLFPDTRILQRVHSNCISVNGSACTLAASAKVDDSISRVMLEPIENVEFGVDGDSWYSMSIEGNVSSEFDLVKISDDQAESLERTQCSFAALSSDKATQYVWITIARAQCRTVLPTDFDPLQPQVLRRYTWMEVSLWPAINVENTMDIPIALCLSQKATTVKLEIAPSSENCLSAINPCEPVDVQLLYEQSSTSTRVAAKPLAFSLEGIAYKDSKEQVFVCEGCKVIANFCNDRRPMVRIRTERILTVANMTPSVLTVSIGNPLGNQRSLKKIDSCMERSVDFLTTSNFLVISIATVTDSNAELGQIEWSPEVLLDVKGDTKPIVVPSIGARLTSLASAYCMEMVNSDGYLKLVIRPQVVVINSTDCALMCVPTDSRGNTLMEQYEPSVISGDNGGWCVPVCLHKEKKKKSITVDMSSWLSLKLSRHSSKDVSNAPKLALVARLSCSFRLKLVEDGYEWTEEISVLLPKIPLLLNPDGKLKVNEASSASTPPTNTDELYPTSSTTTHRRRLLIRHRGFRHKMLTYTMTQKGKSIHILFFVDYQPPVVIHNQWQRVLGFRNVSCSSDPEGIGATFYLEYDWGLQVSTKPSRLKQRNCESNNRDADSDYELMADWLQASQSVESADMSDTANSDRTRFQIGSPQYGWSNELWQVKGIQFASFISEKEVARNTPAPTFLVMCSYRAGSWLVTITCLEDPTRYGHASEPSVLPSMLSPTITQQVTPTFLRVGLVMERLSLHFCDEHNLVLNDRGMILYPEILRSTCNAVSIVFATAPDPPEVSRHDTRLGYLSHVRSYTTFFISIENVEVRHFLRICNFPLILCFPKTCALNELRQIDCVKKHERLRSLMGKLLDNELPGTEKASLISRVIYVDTWDPFKIPSYFHSIELQLFPAVLQVEDDMLIHVNAFIRPMLDSLEGEAAFGLMDNSDNLCSTTCREDTWSLYAYESAATSKQRKVYIERFEISSLDVTVTARVAIPVLNSFDGTPLHFGSTKMRDVFSFPDQLYKDLAADYVADTIVRSPMLLMSLNICGNPAGFLRSFGQGVRDLVEIPLAASRNGYSPWVLTKGVVGGVASFLSHTTAATLTSVSGFSYSISRTTLADGLGSLGLSVVGAAAGVITTPIAVYKERKRQGLDTGIRNVVGGVGMGLVGIVARPVGGVASLVSMASDGLLYGMNGNRTPFADHVSPSHARPNELLRYKVKVLPDAVGSNLIFAHGIWVFSDENKLIVSGQNLEYLSKEQSEASENELLRSILLSGDTTRRLVQVTVVCSNDCVYVVGMSGTQNQAVLARTRLESIEAVEESLKEPTMFDLGVKTSAGVEWLRFRLPPQQRRHLSHQLRLRLTEDSIM